MLFSRRQAGRGNTTKSKVNESSGGSGWDPRRRPAAGTIPKATAPDLGSTDSTISSSLGSPARPRKLPFTTRHVRSVHPPRAPIKARRGTRLRSPPLAIHSRAPQHQQPYSKALATKGPKPSSPDHPKRKSTRRSINHVWRRDHLRVHPATRGPWQAGPLRRRLVAAPDRRLRVHQRRLIPARPRYE